MAAGPGEVFEEKFGVRDVETKRVRVHRTHKSKEVEALLKLDHPNIAKLLHCESDDEYRYYALGPCLATLDQLFLKSDDARKYKGHMPHHIDGLLQLASGLEYIHSKDLVHGDIKPENVLIVEGSAGQDEITLKWTNFGLTRNISEARQTNPFRRNRAWLAPELLQLTRRMENVDETGYQDNVKNDVFALGLVFGSLFLNGEHLYGSIENEIADNIVKGNSINMQKMDGKLRDCYENDVLKKILKNDPKERMTSMEVVVQLHSIKDKLTGKEKELLELCGRDSREDLTGKIKGLIQFGINLDARDKDGRNALHYLCRYHSSKNLIDAIQILIQSGIDAKAKSNDGSNALHYLCRDNSSRNLFAAVDFLTEIGVDEMAKDKDGWTALHYLQNKDKKEMKISFDREKRIGEGGFGTVFKGKFGGREVAVKRVEIHRVNEREEKAMLKLDHPNIVKLLHCAMDKNFMYYVLELCVTSLDQLFLKEDNPKIYDGIILCIFHQLATGLAYIHSKNLIHRDIKPENILIMRSPEKHESIIIKWSDFGLAKSVNEKGLHTWTGANGTRKWFAPEVLKKLLDEEKAKNDDFWGTVKSDVFVLGLVFGYIFLEGKHLFGSSERQIHDNIIGGRPVNMNNIDGEVRKYYEDNLLTKMLEDDPEKRIKSAQVVQQLESIKNKLTEKEKEFRELCATNSSPDLLERINDFIRLGIDVNAKGNDGRNALHNLCLSNSSSNLIDAIQLLIQKGIDVNAKDYDGWNALHYLCKSNSSSYLIDAIQLLIQNGIDMNAKDNLGRNALFHLCGWNKSLNITLAIELLSNKGIDVNARNNFGRNALHLLCRNHSSPKIIDAIQLLRDKEIEVNAKDKFGRNALHYLSESNSSPTLIDAIRLLIKLGIDVNAKDNLGRNALFHLCGWNKSSNITFAIELLNNNGIDVNAKDECGLNALHYLCQSNSSSNLIAAMQLLIKVGIDVNANDNRGRNGLHHLCRNNSSPKCEWNSSPNLIVAIQLLLKLENCVVSNGHDARSYLLDNDKITNKNEILKLLDEALL
ncbi:death-associated protein kinase 1-like [Daphnia carinata]|uniref:death-associated protein kinase 1-like n=1 Tax=Daphnia carinata TaxID=120202 RepID=UPI002869160E|nr:death-associated protein kinase 1-like [Daphnia carinata]